MHGFKYIARPDRRRACSSDHDLGKHPPQIRGRDVIELRGGARHSRGNWHPTGGVGLNVLGAVSFDVAAFSTNTNVERARKLALPVSIRIN